MKNALSKMGENPFSAIVDLRHFASLRKSLYASTSAGSEDFPLELLSNNWWGDLVGLVRSKEMRCLLLEYHTLDPLSLSNCGLGQKEQLSILAKRAACIIGPDVFGSGSHSIEREVITWARRKGKKNIVDKASRVRKILQDALKPMAFRVTKPIISSFDLKWDLRRCKMSIDQRNEYEKCCNEVRGALSSTIEMSAFNRHHYSVPVVSNALFRLRQECFYSRNHAIQSYSSSHNESPAKVPNQHDGLPLEINKRSNFWANSSQPDANRANSILRSSSKLKELISILMNECGYNLNVDEITMKMFGTSKGAKKGKDQKRPVKKIVIFAVLPNIQHIISMLLNSLGIQNELLCRYEAFIENPIHGELKCTNLNKHTQKFESVTWAKSQSVLSRFCADDHCRKTNIIIASPAVLSGRNDGIGIEGADMIIALDSDWSGRDGFIVSSLVRRWHAKNKLSGKEDRLIRLVSANSIEAKIFDDNNGETERLSWPLDANGFFTLPTLQDEASMMYKKMKEDDPPSCYSFPAIGIFQNRGCLLEDFLSSSRLPPLFGSGKPSLFLPRTLNEASTDQETIAEIHFLKYFLHNEESGSISFKSNAPAKPKMKYQISSSGLTSRNDILVIESRLFLEKLIDSYHTRGYGSHSNVLLMNVAQSPGEASNQKIDENPSSLLFYEPYQDSSSNSNGSSTKNMHSEIVDVNIENKTYRRYNAYAKLFSSSWNGISVRDGNQGCEPLVFFPPLFPLLEEVSKKARIEYISSATATTDTQEIVNSTCTNEISSALKRKDRDFGTTRNDVEHGAKRPKTNVSQHNGFPGELTSSGNDTKESTSKSQSDSKDQRVTQNGKAEIYLPTSKKHCSSGVIMVGEDFGLLGCGAFPAQIDATSFSARDSKVNSSYAPSWNRPGDGSNLVLCDTEETSASALSHFEEGMQSVLLFVKKRPRSTQTPYKHSQGLSNKVPLHIGSKAIGDESVKKMRKKGSQGISQLPPTAFTRLSGNLGTQHSQILPRSSMVNSRQVKGDFRHKLLASFYARQRATGLTLFDSVPYRVATMRVEKRMTERLEKLVWKSTLALDAAPGLPIQFVEEAVSVDKSRNNDRQSLASIVDELKDGLSTGSAARTQTSVQKLEFKRSSVSPRCVDFGAFEVGYLSSPSGMTGMPTTRHRVGVSLPMGVRLMRPTKDQEKRSTWNVRDDKILQETAKKFGMNWLLVASATSGFEHAVIKGNISGIEKIMRSVAKSARQCRGRWQLLTQSHPPLSKEVRISERMVQDPALSSSDAGNNIEASDTKGKPLVYSAQNINIICKSEDFLNLPETKALTSNMGVREIDNKNNARNSSKGITHLKQGEVPSPRSTVDKKDDDAAIDRDLMQVVDENINVSSSSVTEDVKMSGSSETTKPRRRSFSAISIAKSRRQIFPITIPGVDVGANQPGHPVSSHPSHMQSVQLSVAAQWASGRTEMWPLQILDLADKQRSSAARMNNVQRGEIPTAHNPSRRHPTSNSSYQHRSQPSQASTVRAPVGYLSGMNTDSRPVAPRPVNPSVTPHHQHRSPQVAAATVQAYIPPQNSSVGKPKKNDKQKPTSKSSPTKG